MILTHCAQIDSLWLKTITEGAQTAAEVRADQVSTVLHLFNPGKQFKRTLDNIDFSKNYFPVRTPWHLHPGQVPGGAAVLKSQRSSADNTWHHPVFTAEGEQ